MPRQLANTVIDGIATGRLTARVEVIDIETEKLLLSTDPETDVPRMKVIELETSMEDSRQIQGMGRVQLAFDEEDPSEMLPVRVGDPLAPVSNTAVQISYKHLDHNDVSDWGRYDIGTAVASETPGSGVMLDLELFDNSRKVERISFYRPGSLNATTMAEALWNLVAVPVPHANFQVDANPHRIEFTTFDTQRTAWPS
jgi:hypothetical protein